MSGLKSVVISKFIPWTSQFEGHTTFMYLDVRGLVTIGYGNLIDPFISPLLDWRDKAGLPVTHSQVVDEWNRVKAMTDKAPLGGMVFRWYTQLRATETSIEALCDAQLESNYSTLRTHWLPDLDSWPAAAQLALMSWAWANGANAFGTGGWPHFLQACKDKAWDVCATECKISEYKNPGVKPRNVADHALFSHCLTLTDETYDTFPEGT